MTQHPSSLRVLVVPDSFKGTMTAQQAAEAMALGVRAAGDELGVEVAIDECPLADGGEGTLDVVRDVLSAREHQASVSGPLPGMTTIDTKWIAWTDKDGRRCGLIESASIVGLGLVPVAVRDPGRVSTKGLGELVAAAKSRGARRIFVALGGSACIDGGVGMAGALGAVFFDSDGQRIVSPVGDDVLRIARVEQANIEIEVIGLCDVDNPLLGAEGAARVYGPQKGATPAQVARLEAGLENLVRVCRDGGIGAHQEADGAGAAGGLGFGLATFLGAELVRGSAWVCDVVGFNERIEQADLVLTGEGRLDEQTARGKVVAEVCRRAEQDGTPVIAIGGQVEKPVDASTLGLRAIYTLDQIAGSTEEALREPERWLEEACRHATIEWVSG